QAQPNATMTSVELTAASLGDAIERRHPSQSFKAKLESGALPIRGYPDSKVVAFLDEHPGFDFLTADVEPYLVAHRLDEDDELKRAVLQTQRVLRLGATQSQTALMLNAGLTSAHAVITAGKSSLIATLSGSAPQWKIATLYDNAHAILSGVLGVASIVA